MSYTKLRLVDSTNPNYYDWGRNCGVLNYSEQEAQQVLDLFYGEYHNYIQDQLDEFWRGYHESIK